jgi:hypothetical protein
MLMVMLLQQDLGAARSEDMKFFALAIVILGVLTMAVIQMVKDLSFLRRKLQYNWIKGWIESRSPAPTGRYRDKIADMSFADLEYYAGLSTDDDRKSFYRLPIDQLCGQLNLALRAAMENASAYPMALITFSDPVGRGDLEKVADSQTLVGQGELKPESAGFHQYAEARNRVAHHVERSIDSLQASIGSRWKFWLQMASLILAIAFAFIMVFWFKSENAFWTNSGDAIGIGFTAGFLAPVFRDIFARLQGSSR